MANRVGQTFGNYKLVERLGEGGVAEVYKGIHNRLGVAAAVKVLKTLVTEDEMQTFQTEARIVAELRHPNIIRVLDFNREVGSPPQIRPGEPETSVLIETETMTMCLASW